MADESNLTLPVAERDHAVGPADAAVTLVEYGDYECPDCGNAYPIIQRLIKEMGPQLRFVFRNFPRSSVHPHAGVAALAAEAAASQGKFWEMHGLLYANQKNLDQVDLVRLAVRAGVEIYRFEADSAGERFARRVAEDYDSGVASGVVGTPTYFVNGVKYLGKKDYESLKGALEAAAASGA
jgi:protein-disulfide isomerase